MKSDAILKITWAIKKNRRGWIEEQRMNEITKNQIPIQKKKKNSTMSKITLTVCDLHLLIKRQRLLG